MYYKDPQNNLHVLDSTEFEHLLPVDTVRITDTEADEIIASKVIPPSADELRYALINAVQAHLDTSAQALGYDDIKTAVTYADEASVLRFQQEGKALRAWRSLCWEYCHVVLTAVMSAEREIPTATQLVQELPLLQLA